jgi:hypothetical protein
MKLRMLVLHVPAGTLLAFLSKKAGRGSHSSLLSVPFFFETVYHYVAQASLELETLLPQPPECWDYRHEFTMPQHGNFLVFYSSPKLESAKMGLKSEQLTNPGQVHTEANQSATEGTKC